MIGIIYLIHAQHTSHYKIGFTAGPVSKRLRTLQTGSPYKLSIASTIEGTAQDEAELHKRFLRYRLHGEWFHFPNIRVLYKPFPSLRPFVETDWNADTIAKEIAHQVVGYTMMMRPATVAKRFGSENVGEFWYAMANRLGIKNERPDLSDETICEIIKIQNQCPST